MRDMFKMGFMLMAICALAALLLSLVYGVTSIQIAENDRIAAEKKRKIVLPTASRYEEKEKNGETYYQGLDADGKVIGTIITVAPRGYGGPIKLTVGVLEDKSIAAIEVTKLDHKETPGLGAKIVTEKFKKQFKGKSAKQLKVKQDGGEIDAITAATITSRAVADGIREGLVKFFNE